LQANSLGMMLQRSVAAREISTEESVKNRKREENEPSAS
jgi:hypothetical protein